MKNLVGLFSSCSNCLYRQTARFLHNYRVFTNSTSVLFWETTKGVGIYPAKSIWSLRGLQNENVRCFTLSNRTLSDIPALKYRMKARELAQQPVKADQTVHHQFAVLERLHELEERLRVRGYSLLRWGLGLAVVGVATLYMFREKVRENVADEVADVASRSLVDENVVNKANEMTKLVLQDIINDPETTRLASNFVMSVLSREDVRSSAVELTLFVLKDPKTQTKVRDIAAETLKDIVNQPELRTILLGYVKGLLLDESTRDVCKDLLRGVLQDVEVKEFMSESLGNLVASAIVRNKAVELGKSVTHEVVSDTEIQKETGDALWTVIKSTVTPGWFG